MSKISTNYPETHAKFGWVGQFGKKIDVIFSKLNEDMHAEAALKKLKVADLRAIIDDELNGSSKGLTKPKLISLIMELQAASPETETETVMVTVTEPISSPAPTPTPTSDHQDNSLSERQSLQKNLHQLLKRFVNSSVHPSALSLGAD